MGRTDVAHSALQVYFHTPNIRTNGKPHNSMKARNDGGVQWVFIEWINCKIWIYPEVQVPESWSNGMTFNSIPGASWNTSWMTSIPTNTQLSVKLQLGTATPKFISPSLTFRSWGNYVVTSFPFNGSQTSPKIKAATCRGAGNMRGGARERAMRRWLRFTDSTPSFGATSDSEHGEGCWPFWDSASQSYLGLHWLRRFRDYTGPLIKNLTLSFGPSLAGSLKSDWSSVAWLLESDSLPVLASPHFSRFSSHTLGLLTALICKIHEDILQNLSTQIWPFLASSAMSSHKLQPEICLLMFFCSELSLWVSQGQPLPCMCRAYSSFSWAIPGLLPPCCPRMHTPHILGLAVAILAPFI